MPYRDSGAPLDAELDRLAAEVRTLGLRITPAYFRRLDPSLARWRERIDRPLPDPRARLDELGTLRDQLAQAIAQAPTLQAALTALPRRVPVGLVGPTPPLGAVELAAAEWLDVPYARARRLEAQVARAVGHHDPKAIVRAWGRHAQVAAFEGHGAPLALHAETLLTGGAAVSVATAVARGAGPLEVRRLGWREQLATALRWKIDTRFGDPGFDDRFLVAGEGARLLTPTVREQLLTFSRWTPPRLEIGGGAAVLRYRYVFSGELVERALRILGELRHAPLSLSLVRDAP